MCSRQDDYRIRMLRAGLCVLCGKERLETATLGPKCRLKRKMQTARWRMKKQLSQYKFAEKSK